MTVRCRLLTSFNADNLAAVLRADGARPALEVTSASFGGATEALFDPDAGAGYDLTVVWTQPAAVIASFERLLRGEAVPLERILAEVDAFAGSLAAAARRVPLMMVASWVRALEEEAFPTLAMQPGIGASHALAAMNLRLAEALAPESRVRVLDAGRWVQGVRNAFHPKLWYMAKSPFANEVFQRAARDLKAALRGVRGEARKLVIVDLDDTLWGGIVGEDGWEKLNLGGHDPIGEAFVDFQKALQSLARRGVLLAIVSKNDEPKCVEAFRRHPEMVLKLEDFAARRINWKDKAQNVAELVSGLRLGLDAAVFIDDSPVERARVREALPEVLVPEWPEDKMLYRSALLALDCFDRPAMTEADAKRTELYRAEEQREELRAGASFDEWLQTLDLVVRAERLNAANLQRAAQLLNKTNQLNLATRRMPEGELERWAEDPRHEFFTFRVGDRFGDSGLVGLASYALEGDVAEVADFVLSCRVIGRRVEETMLHTLVQAAAARAAREVRARLLPTPKNGPCLEFFQRCGWAEEGEHRFRWDATRPYPLPAAVRLESELGEPLPPARTS